MLDSIPVLREVRLMGKPATSVTKSTSHEQTGSSEHHSAHSSGPVNQSLVQQSAVGNLALQYSANDADNLASSSEWSFDPYAENVVELTNGNLVIAILDTDDWLAENGIIHLDYDAYRIRQERLESERQARVEMGHLWLETVHDRQSYTLYQTIAG